MSTGINKTLLALRLSNNFTQEDVANHLGITKAAVSKWECGQSMPDISLLPAIADLYSTTIDALFDRPDELRPEEINDIYSQALALLGQEYESGLEYIKKLTRDHWTSYPLLHMMSLAMFTQLPQLPGFNEGGLSDQALECAQETERLVRRALELTSFEEGSVADLPVLSRVLLWTGRGDEAKALIEARVRKEPDLSAATLAQLYRESGCEDQAITVLQRTILVALLEAESALMALSPLVAGPTLIELAELACKLQSNESYVSVFPILMPTIRLQQAKDFFASGEESSAKEALNAFAVAVDRACEAMIQPTNPPVFDKVTEMLWSDATEEIEAERAGAVSNLRESYAAALEGEEFWSGVKNRDWFIRLVEHVRTGCEGAE